MRRQVCLLLVFVLGVGPAHADDEGGALPQRLGEAEAAALAIEAHAAGGAARLAQLARRDAPDPWLVADELGRQDRHDVAAAFARAAPRAATAKLPAYVEAETARGDDADAERTWAAVSQAFARGDMQAAADAAGKLEGAADSVVRVRIAYVQGLALLRLGQLEPAVRHLLRSAAAGRELGWIVAAAGAYADAARAAYQRSDWPGALGALRDAHAIQTTLGATLDAARTLAMVGLLHQKLADYDAALEAQTKALEALREARDEAGAAATLGNIGIVHVQLGAYPKALEAFRQALAYWEVQNLAEHIASTLGRIGVVQEKLGDYVDAVNTHLRALALQEERADVAAVARTRANIGNALVGLSDYMAALRIQEQVLEAKRALKDRAGEALTLGNLGTVYWHLADYPQALQLHRRALALQRSLQDRSGAASALTNIGTTLLEMGDYAGSVHTLEEALVLQRSIKDRAGEAHTLGGLGRLYMELGDHEQAWARFDGALAISTELKNRAGIGWTLSQMGVLRQVTGEDEAALAIYLRALALRRAVGDKAGAAFVTSEIGVLRRKLGQFDAAVEAQHEAIAAGSALLDRHVIAHARGQLGLTYLAMGKPKDGLAMLEDAVNEARELRITPLLLDFLGPLARARLEAGDAGRALAEAHSALRDIEDILGGLGEEEGALARERHADVFGIGALAALRLDAPKDAFTFLESGRASLLLESLKGRRALRWADLPEALRKDEAAAKAQETRARHEYERTWRNDQRQEARAAKDRLDAARARAREVSARIQREAKRQAGIFYPRATTLEKLQQRLPPDTAFVIYGFCLDEAIALVVTTRNARFVELGGIAAVRSACAALEADDRYVQPTEAIDRLRKMLVARLALGPAIRNLLISPDDRLCYLPWGYLAKDRVVTLVPSGTTYVHLRDEVRTPGEGILALGDPLYGQRADKGATDIYRRAGALRRLPATREEVEAVGTVRLLGADAHERGLRESLARKPRWRAVHLACHGLVDPEHPMLSSLALTQDGMEDGYLTCIEVLRSTIPADLAVLSACETAKGRTYRAEGIVGLTRAFMYAGAPRVICSLWRADDDASLALMKKFYELWAPREPAKATPRIGAAAALAAAQAFVREDPKWQHPYFWAGWVLWGLPD